jgi:hypothetical protein
LISNLDAFSILQFINTKVDGVQQRRLPIIASCAIFAAASPLVP